MSGDAPTNWGAISAVTFMTAAIGGIFLLGGPLQSQRPDQRGTEMPQPADEVVTARLWQDPLEAIRLHWRHIVSHVEEHATLPSATSWPKTVKRWAWDARGSKRELRLFIAVSGAPYAEDSENRRRQRYAIVTALTELDYEPVQSDRVGYFVAPALGGFSAEEACFPKAQSKSTVAPPSGLATKLSARFVARCTSLVGFERYKPAPGDERARWDTITVLWLDADGLGERPLDALAALDLVLDRVRPTGRPGTHHHGAGSVSVLLGPHQSGILRKMKTSRTRPPETGRSRDSLCRASAYPWRFEDLFDANASPDARCRASSDTGNGDPFNSPKMHLVRQQVAQAAPTSEQRERVIDCLKLVDPVSIMGGVSRCLADGNPASSLVIGLAEELVSRHPEAFIGLGRPWRDSDLDKQRRQMHVLSTHATVPLDQLFDDRRLRIDSVEQAPGTEGRLAEELEVASFGSLVARDDLVLTDILRELTARGACRGGTATLAIISEQDSVYGRRFGDVIRQRLSGRKAAGLCKFDVREFGYLLGVDGESLTPEAKRGPTEEPQDAPRTGTGVERLLTYERVSEGAFGDAQLDYVRRLAGKIDRANALLDDRRGFVAIGILGTDVYDKQLILQALRMELPSATFFTTDLDARLGDPKTRPWTRNLIVGSAYGLSARDHKGPAFRDSYQTALYRAVRIAHRLPAVPRQDAPRQTCERIGRPHACAPSPKLFEVGLKEFVDITDCKELCEEARFIHSDSELASVYRRVVQTGVASLGVLGPLLIFGFATLAMTHRLRRPSRRYWAHRNMSVLALVSAVVLAACIYEWLTAGSEPGVFFQGVSTIPTVVLDVTTVVLSIGVVVIGWGRTAQGDRETESKFGTKKDEKEEETKEKKPGLWDLLFPNLLQGERKEQGKTEISTIWARHERASKPVPRVLRLAVPWLISIVVVVWVLETHDQPLVSRHLDMVATAVRLLAVTAVVTAALFWADLLRLERKLIREVAWSDVRNLKGKKDAEVMPRDFTQQRRRSMDLIVDRTEVVAPVMVFPFVLLPLLMVSRSTVFEGWAWTWSMFVVYASVAGFLLINVLLFQTEALEARDRIRLDLVERRYSVVVKHQRRHLKLAIQQIDGLREGAFVRWTGHPIFQSVALVLGGLGLVLMLDFLF